MKELINKNLVCNQEEFNVFLNTISPAVFSFDTETTGLNIQELEIVGMSFCDGNNSWYIPFKHNNIEQLKFSEIRGNLTKLFLNARLIIGHNLVFDMQVIKKYGIYPESMEWFDTMIAAHLLDENKGKGLKDLSQRLLGYKMKSLKEMSGNSMDVRNAPISEAMNYACDDAIQTYKLFELFKEQLKKQGLVKLFREIEMPFLRTIIEMESNGVLINQTRIKELQAKTQEKIIYYKNEITKLLPKKYRQQSLTGENITNFSVDSSTQLKKLLFEDLKLPIKIRSEKTQEASTGVEALNALMNAHPIILLIHKYREYAKLKSGFLEALPKHISKNGRIHCRFNPVGARTGRLASDSPNLQNLPNNDEVSVRSCFIASPGMKMIVLDYSQEELRLAAFVSKERVMIDSFKQGADFHLLTANRIFKLNLPNEALVIGNKEYKEAKEKYYAERHKAKTTVFSILYGITEQGLAERLKVSVEEAKTIIENFFKGFPNVKRSIDATHNFLRKNGFVKNYYGRYRHFIKVNGRYPSGAFRQSYNYLIQGCVASNMRIIVKNKGYLPIKDFKNKRVHLWDGQKYVGGLIKYSGKKQKVIIRFKNGQEIITSPEHKFLTVNSYGKEAWKNVNQFYKSRNNPEKIRLTNSIPEFNSQKKIKQSKSISVRLNYWKQYKIPHNYYNYSFEDIKNNYDLGVVLGRLASDGTYGRHTLSWIFAQHEYSILPTIENILKPFKYTKTEKTKKELTKYGRKHNPIIYININSMSLLRQCEKMNLKNGIPQEILSNKERLRGFLKGFFDGDGGVTNIKEFGNKNLKQSIIRLTFGKRHSSTCLPKDIQQALLLFGIKSRLRYYPYCVHISISRTKDVLLFKKEIGFINKEKNNKIIERPFKQLIRQGATETVKEVIITDEFIDMYDVINSDSGRFMCEGFVVHNSAADLLRVSMVGILKFLKQNNYEAKLLFTVHDEIGLEVPEDKVQYYLDSIKKIMEKSLIIEPRLVAEGNSGNNYAEAK